MKWLLIAVFLAPRFCTAAVLTEKTSESIGSLREYLQAKGDDARAWQKLGLAYAAEGQHGPAADAFRLSLSHGNTDAHCHCSLALSLRETFKRAAALAEVRHCLTLDPTFATGWNLLGNLEHDQGNFDAALKAYQRAVKLKPDYANAYFNLGLVFASLLRDEESVAAFRKARRLNPKDADIGLGLSRALKRMKKEKIERH